MHDGINVEIENRAVPVPWPARGGVDGYPWDLDPSQRFTRLKTGRDYWPDAHVNTTSPGGWLRGIYAFLPLIDNAAFAMAYMKGQITPGPWTQGGVAVVRAGGIPWQTSMNPIAGIGRKSG